MKSKLFFRYAITVFKFILMAASAIIVIAWLIEKISHQPNFVITFASQIAHKDHWMIAAIVVLLFGSIFFKNRASYSHKKSW